MRAERREKREERREKKEERREKREDRREKREDTREKREDKPWCAWGGQGRLSYNVWSPLCPRALRA